MKKKTIAERALELMAHRFLKYGRCDCGEIKCKEKNTPSCEGKRRICEKSHIAYFKAKAGLQEKR